MKQDNLYFFFFFFFFLQSDLEPRNLYLSYFEFEVTSSAIVGLNAFLSSPHLPDEGSSGLLWNLFLAQRSNSLMYGGNFMTKKKLRGIVGKFPD